MPSLYSEKRPGRIAATVLTFCLIVFAASAGASDLPPPAQTAGIAIPDGQVEAAIDQLDGLAAALLERSGIPALAVAVVHNGETVYAKGFGVRKRGEEAKVDADTVFQIASLSKSIGATVVAHQVDAGVVTWDTPVSEHLPWFALADAWVSRQVTIGDLFAHRSGLPDHAGDDLEDLGFSRNEILERLHLLPLKPFRAHYAYTNFGLTAAAEAVAVASGTDWASLSEQVLFGPLGMTSTSSRFADFETRDNRAHGHVRDGKGYAALHTRQPDAQSPAGGVSTSVRDMAKWMAMVLGGGARAENQIVAPEALLPAVTAQVISSPSYATDARPGFYGYGFDVGVQPSGRVSVSHSGAFYLGVATSYLMIPSVGTGIVVLSNATPVGAVEALTSEFADLVQYGEVTRDWFAGFEALMAPIVAPVGRLVGEARPAGAEPAADLAAYVGVYHNDYFGAARVERRDDRLVLAIGPGGQEHVLEHWQGDRFTYEPFGENAPAGSISEVAFDRAAETMTVEFLDTNGLGTFAR